jgi:hypothetical protein
MSDHDHDEEVHLPSPSVWPFTVAGGFTLMGFGILTSLALSALGLVFLIWGLYGWIQELRRA